MIAELEALDSSCRTACRHHVLPFVPAFLFGSREAFALDRQERVELCVPTTFYNNDGSTRIRRQVDGSSGSDFVSNFSAKLDPAPPGRGSCRAVQMIAELAGQGRFGAFWLS